MGKGGGKQRHSLERVTEMVKLLLECLPVVAGVISFWKGLSPYVRWSAAAIAVVGGILILIRLGRRWRRRQRTHYGTRKLITVAVAPLSQESDGSLWTEKLLHELGEAGSSCIKVMAAPDALSEADGQTATLELADTYHADYVVWGYTAENERAADVTVYIQYVGRLWYPKLVEGCWTFTTVIEDVRAFRPQKKLALNVAALCLTGVGLSRFEMGDYPTAVSMFSQVLKSAAVPREMRPIIHILRARCYAAFGDGEKAEADFQTAMEYGTFQRSALVYRGVSRFGANRIEEAFQDFEDAAQVTPNEDGCLLAHLPAAPHYALGTCHLLGGKLQQAIEDLSAAISLDPGFYFAYINRGTCYRLLGEWDAALADFGKCVQLEPKNDTAYVNRGIVHRYQGHFDLALADYNAAIRLRPTANAHYNRAILYLHTYQLWKAIRDLGHALSLNPKHQDAYLFRGLTLLHMRPLFFVRQALADFDRAIECGGRHLDPAVFRYRAAAYHALGEHAKAQADEAHAAQLPSHPSYVNLRLDVIANPLDPKEEQRQGAR